MDCPLISHLTRLFSCASSLPQVCEHGLWPLRCGVGVGGSHITNESWELDHGCNSVHWCDILVVGCEPQRCGPPCLTVMTSRCLLLLTLNVAFMLLLCLSFLQRK
jgi:hypothetical protein